MLLLFAGLPGTGKSTLARATASRLGGHVLDKDFIRDEMFGASGITFTAEQDDLVVDAMLVKAKELLTSSPATRIYFDGRVFSRNAQLKHAINFAESIPTRWIVVECVCSPETAKARIAADFGKHVAANRTSDLYDRVRARFEPIPEPKLVIDSEQPFDSCIRQLLSALKNK